MDLQLCNPPWIQEKLGFKEGFHDTLSTGKCQEVPRLSAHDSNAFLDLIKSCRKCKDLHRARSLHADAVQKEMVPRDIYTTTALISIYAKCGDLGEAQKLFDELPVRDVVSWNALIAGYAQHGLGFEALNCYRQMQDDGIFPDVVTFVCILKACGSIRFLEIGEEIHAEASRQGLLENNIVLGNTLVDMYAKCGALGKAQEVFDEMLIRNVITWSALITGYAQHGLSIEALKCFRQMRDDGISPDAVTFISVLKVCGSIRYYEMVEEIHAEVNKKMLLEKNIVLGSTLVDTYAKCGELGKAQEIFDEMPVRNVITWSALIAGYAQDGLFVEALKCFRLMQDSGISPNGVSFICVLKACGNIGSLEIGKEIHTLADNQALLEKDHVLGNALLDMYAKCGELGKAQKLFEEMSIQNVIAWSALMAGYAQLGQVIRVLNLFRNLAAAELLPNPVTLAVVLTACSHAGFVEEGQSVFGDMNMVYHLTPTLDHHACMVDLLSRAGHFDHAIGILKVMPFSDCLPLLSGLLGGCRKWFEVEIGRWAFEQLLRLDVRYTDAYVCMGSIYASAGMYAQSQNVEALILRNRAGVIIQQRPHSLSKLQCRGKRAAGKM